MGKVTDAIPLYVYNHQNAYPAYLISTDLHKDHHVMYFSTLYQYYRKLCGMYPS